MNRAVVVTSTGDLVRFDGTGLPCNSPSSGRRRLAGSFLSEPLAYSSPVSPDSITYVVGDAAGQIHNLRIDGTAAVVQNPGWPASLPAGRVSPVPAALDALLRVTVVDDIGDVHVFSTSGVRSRLGSTGAAPAAGPLVLRRAVVVATETGSLVAFEGGGDAPSTGTWVRDGGNLGATASTLCVQSPPGCILPVGALLLGLGWRPRRRGHHDH